jgi:NAD(P)-dependent dehydrogenase (short-subunit alcohol dehydrogenase family)
MFPISLKGKVAVVTGGSGGIGQAIVKYLAKAGANVIVSDIDLESAEKIVADLKSGAFKAMAVKTDVTKPEDMHLLVERALQEFGTVDIMVNNAGVNSLTSVEDMSKDGWDRVMDINLWGVFLGCKYASRPMMKQKLGKIVNISSQNAKAGGVFSGMDYTGSKAGVWAITKSFAKLLAPYKINVNAICPGPVDTPMHRELTEEQRTTLTKSILWGRFGLPEDIAGAVLFLSSDLADFITGVALDVNGGALMY